MNRKRVLSLLLTAALVISMAAPALGAYSGNSDGQHAIIPADSLAHTQPAVAPHTSVTHAKGSFTVTATVENFIPKLTITADGLNGSKLSAAVMDVKSYMGGTLSGVVTNFTDSTRFENPKGAGLTNTEDYHYNTGEVFSANGVPLTIGLPGFVGGGQAALRSIDLKNTASSDVSTNGDNGTAYYRSYVFVVQAANIGGANAADYAVGTFVMDSEGNLLDESYMVRYMKNVPSNNMTTKADGTVKPQITPAADKTTLRAEKYTRSGYEFKGWDTDPALFEQWKKTPNASSGDARFIYESWADIAAAGKVPAYQPGDALPKSGELPARYGITDLYAAWYPIQVGFAEETYTLPILQVGKSRYNDVEYGTAAKPAIDLTGKLTSTSAPGTAKTYTVVASSWWSGANHTTAGGDPDMQSAHQDLPNGLKLQNGKLFGTPTVPTDKPVWLTVRVTDTANGTFDEVKLVIPEIKKGAQTAPDLDVNTGLETGVATLTGGDGDKLPADVEKAMVDEKPDDAIAAPADIYGDAGYEDGRIVGMYSVGQPQVTIEGVKRTDGAGTYTDYYLNNGILYEYRPRTEAGGLPWREVPLPRDKYSGDKLTDVQLGMGYLPAKRAVTVLSGKNVQSVTLTDETWTADYGWIEWDVNGRPVVHGLTKDGQYEVRFRANDAYEPSDPVTLTIGGAVGGGSVSVPEYSVVFNLMGGKVYKTETAPAPEPEPEPPAPEIPETLEDGEEPPVTPDPEPVKTDVTGTDDDPFAKAQSSTDPNGTVRIPGLPAGVSLEKEGSTFLGFTDGTQLGTAESPYLQPGAEYPLPGHTVGLAAVWSQKASPAEFRSVTLLDWDDAVVGTAVINRSASGAEIKEAVDAVAKILFNGDMAQIGSETYLNAETWTEENPASAVLTAKKGYNFMGWADTTAATMSDTWTAYADVDEYAAAKSAVLTAENAPDGGWDNLYLKAGYVENGFCNYKGEDVAEAEKSYYSISDLQYNRYGAATVNLSSSGAVTSEAGNYSIKMTVKRENSGGYGVTRLRAPVVRVYYTMNVGGTDMKMFAFSEMSSQDYQIAEVIAPRNASTMTLTVVDSGQITNGKTIASYILSNAKSTVTNVAKSTYLPEATLNYFNEKARAHNEALPEQIDADWNSSIGNPDFYDLGLYRADLKQYYYQYGKAADLEKVTNATQLRNMAKNKITLYMLGKGNRDLTVDEIKEAIQMQTGTANNNKVPAALSTAIRVAYGNVQKAYEANGNMELTVNQIAYAINNEGALLPG